jgi:hypothetical protein
MNKNGDYLRTNNKREYEDWTNYFPVNSPWPTPNPDPDLLKDQNRWVPLEFDNGFGLFSSQIHITPQLIYRSTWTNNINPLNNSQFHTCGPHKYYKNKKKQRNKNYDYINQVDEVLKISAHLTDEQKLMAELFDDKIRGYGIPANYLYTLRKSNLDFFIWSAAAREFILQDALSGIIINTLLLLIFFFF